MATAGSRIVVEVAGDSDSLVKAAQVSADALTGLADRATKLAATMRDSGAQTTETNAKVADSFAGLADAARASADGILAATREMAVGVAASADESAAATGRVGESFAEALAAARASSDGIVQAAARQAEAVTAAADGTVAAQDRMASAAEGSADKQVVASKAAGDASAKSAAKSDAAFGSASSSLTKAGKAIVIGLAGVAAASVYMAAQFQSSNTKLMTQAGASATQVKQLTAGMLDMAGAVAQSPKALSEGMYHIVSSMNAVLPAATRTNQELQILRVAAEGANVGGTDLGDTTYALASAMNALHQNAGQARGTMAELNAIVGSGDMTMGDLLASLKSGLIPAANTFGVSLQSVGAALALMGDQGIRGAQAGTRLRMSIALLGAPSQQAAKYLEAIGMSANRAISSSSEMSAVLAKAGLSLTTISGDLRKPDGLQVALVDLDQHLQKAGLSAQGAGALISRAFGGGRSGAVIELMAESTGRLGVKYQQIGRMVNTFGSDVTATQHTLTYEIHSLEDEVDALAIRFGTMLIPVVQTGIGDLEDLAKWFDHNRVAAAALATVVTTFATVAVGSYLTSELKKAIGLMEQFGRLTGLAKPVSATTPSGGGAVAAVGGAAGVIEGIAGPVAPGSIANPMAVVVKAGEFASGMGSQGAKITQEGGMVTQTEETSTAATEGAAAATAATQATSEGEAVAAGVSTSLAASVKSSLSGLLGGLMKGGLIAGVGTLGSQVAGGVIGGKAGGDVSTIGTDAAIGAGVGSLAGPEGTIIGALGGALVGGLSKLLSSPSLADQLGKQVAAGGGAGKPATDAQAAAAQQAAVDGAQVTRLLNAIDKLTPTTLVKNKEGTLVPGYLRPSPAAEAKQTQLSQQAGQYAAQAMDVSLQTYQHIDPGSVIESFTREFAALPKRVQDYGAQAMEAWAVEMERDGQLPRNSLGSIIKALDAEFPNIKTAAAQAGLDTSRAISDNLNFQQAKAKVGAAVTAFSSQYSQIGIAVKAQDGDLTAQITTTMEGLRNVISSSSGSMKTQALTEYAQLKTQAESYFTEMASTLIDKQQSITTNMQHGTHQTVQAAAANYQQLESVVQQAMNSGVMSTKQGAELIGRALNAALSALGQKQISLASVAAVTGLPAGLGVISVPGAASGWIGNPGEKGADAVPIVVGRGEAVLNHQQQAIVNDSLAATGRGSLSHVFAATSGTRHYMASGGFAGSGPTLGKGQLEQLWIEAGGSRALANTMAAIALAESSGIDQTNSIGAAGYWQIYGLPFAGNPLDPLTNARMAVAKERSQGLSAWVTYQTGAYKQFLGAGAGSSSLAGIASQITAPKVTGAGAAGSVAQGALNQMAAAANTYLQQQTPALPGGVSNSGAAVPGPFSAAGLGAGLAAMVNMANQISSHHYNYEWGGGHNGSFTPTHGSGHGSGPGVGYDCSGAVSAVLHAGGLLSSPLTAGQFMTWGQPGPGSKVSIWASPSHTFMELNGHYFGTATAQNPGGGADWMSSFPGAIGPVRHPAGYATGGMVDGSQVPGAVRVPGGWLLPGMAAGGIAGKTNTTRRPHQTKTPPARGHNPPKPKTPAKLSLSKTQLAKLGALPGFSSIVAQYTADANTAGDTTSGGLSALISQVGSLPMDTSSGAGGAAGRFFVNQQDMANWITPIIGNLDAIAPGLQGGYSSAFSTPITPGMSYQQAYGLLTTAQMAQAAYANLYPDDQAGTDWGDNLSNLAAVLQYVGSDAMHRLITSGDQAILSFVLGGTPMPPVGTPVPDYELGLYQAAFNQQSGVGKDAVKLDAMVGKAIPSYQHHLATTKALEEKEYARYQRIEAQLNALKLAKAENALAAADRSYTVAERKADLSGSVQALDMEIAAERAMPSPDKGYISQLESIRAGYSAQSASVSSLSSMASASRAVGNARISVAETVLTQQLTPIETALSALGGSKTGVGLPSSGSSVYGTLQAALTVLQGQTSSDATVEANLATLTGDIQGIQGAAPESIASVLLQQIPAGSSTDESSELLSLQTQLAATNAQAAAIASSLQATITSLGPLLPKYEHGTPSVPRTGLALVHEGETIIPNPRGPYGSMLAGGGYAGGGMPKIEIHEHYHGEMGELSRFIDKRVQHPGNVERVNRGNGQRVHSLSGTVGGWRRA